MEPHFDAMTDLRTAVPHEPPSYLLSNGAEEADAPGLASSAPQASPPSREVSETEIAALFSADLDPEVVRVPGHPNSWFALRPMGRKVFNKWLMGTGALAAPSGDASKLDIDEYQVSLFLATVVDFHLERRKSVPAEDGGSVVEVTRPPQTHNSNEWRQGCRAIYDAFTPALGKWLMLECQRVNGMEEGQQKRLGES